MEPQMSDQVVKLRDAQGKRGTARAVPDRSTRDISEAKAGPERDAVTTSDTDDRPDTHDTRHEVFDHVAQVWLSRFTHGLSPAALMNAWFDWATHMVAAPGKQLEIAEKSGEKFGRYMRYAMACTGSTNAVTPCIDPLPQDNRFCGEAWKMPPL
ncbi:poly-beta-hydroxybutyrate polymerase N-terminal domain-containing protein [Aurantimonas marianensis]|uniref:Poly-beta-hydroxybutyrate polymerase N-terminal domain-containing protein n=1 Tax=Aurantimonas marianensis TaxID=2920428 RepID=A0A9X2HC82_9HYPH|nr:poly-beta-hydroxybutyrate polymerase N-terminal domain-containing protein [Aurantimonas marianensis]MCP3055787.1 poly-beta-hydroxybutyrate polymerase N-terminal domain-containing protein [Aurantimonas marianensis]